MRSTPDLLPLNAAPYLVSYSKTLQSGLLFWSVPFFNHQNMVSLPKTAMVTSLGSYCFRKLPMGLCNAGASFQLFVNEVYRGLPFVFLYIDDVLIFSKAREEHMRHLTLVFERLKYRVFQKSWAHFDVECVKNY